MSNCWDLSGRDVVPDLAPAGRPSDPGAAVLFAMLSSDGTSWAPDYQDFRRTLGVRARTRPVEPELQEQANSRLRTYMTLFRGLGMVYEESSLLRVTDLGESLLRLLEDQYRATDDFGRGVAEAHRSRLARMVGPALARYQLASPLSHTEYPEGTDIRPLLAIWRAMRALDDRIHWDELDRTLTTCLKESEVPAAIEKIRAARSTEGYDPSDPDLLTTLLGPRRPEQDNQSDRVDVWLSRAGFKNLFLEPRDRTDGYRYLNADHVSVVDAILADPPPFNPTTDKSAYVEWMGGAPPLPAATDGESSNLNKYAQLVVQRCRAVGQRQIVALVGPAGTGKTVVARRAAGILADGDPTRVAMIQFHAAFSYEEFIGGLRPDGDGRFVPTPGALVLFNDLAMKDLDHSYVLVIDELSRADVANVLGELLTYIEYRDQPFHVPSLQRDVRIAPNLLILATMNPSDRSVLGMDDALIRRLRQIEISRSASALRSILSSNGCEPRLIDQVVDWFDSLPDDTPFGHGLFTGIRTEADLRELWDEELRHYLWRGNVPIYPEPEQIERGFLWRTTLATTDGAGKEPEQEPTTVDELT